MFDEMGIGGLVGFICLLGLIIVISTIFKGIKLKKKDTSSDYQKLSDVEKLEFQLEDEHEKKEELESQIDDLKEKISELEEENKELKEENKKE